ncbi:MAG: amidase [Alphaproteobacteria bacterium]|nr:amidase [Alphaproteobacteria bacterium]
MTSHIARRRMMQAAASLVALTSAPAFAKTAAKGGKDKGGKGKPKSDALGDLDGVGVAARIRAKEITPLEAVEAAIARAEAVNPKINAIVTPMYDRARGQAKALTAPAGPFAGLPTFIKDLADVEGVPTKNGSRAFANNVAKSTSPYVAAVLRSGAIAIGKSTTPEFGFTATTEPLLGGATRNPWSLDHSSGGSSGGAAALVAAGVVPVAHASDGGGSIRIPAACCGLFGFKPSRFRMIGDRDASEPVSISVNNCVSHSVRDSATWFAAGENTGADAAYPAVGLVAAPTKRKLRIGVAIEGLIPGQKADPEVRAAAEKAAKLCRSLGHEVFEYAPKLDGQAFANAFSLYWASGAAQITAAVARMAPNVPIDQLLEPLTLKLTEMFKAAPAGSAEKAIETLKATDAAYAAMFAADIDVLLSPVLSRPPLKIGEIAPTRNFDEMWTLVNGYVAYTPLENAAGAPAMSVPLGWSASGLPIGVQFAAAKGEDALLYGLAYQLEEAAPWARKHPPVWAG